MSREMKFFHESKKKEKKKLRKMIKWLATMNDNLLFFTCVFSFPSVAGVSNFCKFIGVLSPLSYNIEQYIFSNENWFLKSIFNVHIFYGKK